jgi:hypothetical protein
MQSIRHYFLLEIYGANKYNEVEYLEKLNDFEAIETKYLPKEEELISFLKEKYNLDKYDYLKYILTERNEREINKGILKKERFKNKELK